MKKYITQIVAILVSSGVIAALNMGLVDWLNSVAAVVVNVSLTPEQQKVAIVTLTMGTLVTLARNTVALIVKYYNDKLNPPTNTYIVK